MPEKFVKKILDLIEQNFHILALLVLAVAGFNYFYHLGAERVWDWDEARAGVSAFEMIQDHNFIVSTFGHRTEMWNLKPPLGSWLIALDYKFFGFNVFALRFYSALSCFLCVLTVMWVMARHAGKVPAFFSGFILATTSPMVFIHGARSGDYSPIFTLLVLLFLIGLLESRERPFLYGVTGILFAMSFLVYSFAAFQLMILALLYWTLTGEYQKISFKNYSFFFGLAFLPIAGWFFWRFLSTDGRAFLSQMVSYDLIQRATRPLEGHAAHSDYYLMEMAKGDPYWFTFTMVVLFSFLAVIGSKVDRKNRLILLSGLGVLVPLVLFSLAKTKLGWYMIPTHPPFAMGAGYLAWVLLKEPRCQISAKWVLLVLFLVAGLRSEREIVKQIKNPVQEASQNLLNDLKKMDYPSDSVIYAKGWTQAPFFVAEVVCGLNPVSIKDLNECLGHQGFLMVVKDKQDPEGLDFVTAHHLATVLQNDDWMIVKL